MSAKAKNSKDESAAEETKVSDIARKIWLAGLGAYGKAFDDVTDQYDKMSKETSKFFEDLVSKGKVIDEESQEKFTEAKEKTTTTIEERINKVRNTFFGSFGHNQISELNKKVDELSNKIDRLIDTLEEEKTTTKSSTAKKAKAL